MNCRYCGASVEQGANGRLFDATGDGAPHYCVVGEPDRTLLCYCGECVLIKPSGVKLMLDGCTPHNCGGSAPIRAIHPKPAVLPRQVVSGGNSNQESKEKRRPAWIG